jgi:hypothetical protein
MDHPAIFERIGLDISGVSMNNGSIASAVIVAMLPNSFLDYAVGCRNRALMTVTNCCSR